MKNEDKELSVPDLYNKLGSDVTDYNRNFVLYCEVRIKRKVIIVFYRWYIKTC